MASANKSKNVSQKILASHIEQPLPSPGEEIALQIDQTLTQDATGTLALLEFESLEVPKVKTELSAQYVDHNLIQEDYKNPDDHLFLRSACQKYGLWYSRPGNGVSHPLHMERFGIPGKTLLGSDSHTCAAGSLGMIAIGAGGLEVAIAMAGQPFHLSMPKIMGVRLTGKLPDWVSAKDIILEMLRRHDVKGGVGKIIEYYGPGLDHLTAMDRHVIANMGAELGATTTVFPSDQQVKRFLQSQERGEEWVELLPDESAEYDEYDEIDLSTLEPLIALPSSPGNVVPVQEVEGREISQSYIGSSANPGLRDFAVPAMMVKNKQVHDRVSLDINPTSRQILEHLISMGYMANLIHAGARLHQAGCNGCIGMGQAPATGRISLRTVPRNFPGRSGTVEDQVYLCSPETAIASAIKGEITDPRNLDMDYPRFEEPERYCVNRQMFLSPPSDGQDIKLEKGPNIGSIPDFEPFPDQLEVPVNLKLEDNISTDEIMPAGAEVLPFRSNIKAISRFVFRDVDKDFVQKAKETESGFAIIAGENYGQGSSREHAAIAPRYLGLRLVIAKSFARIHYQNLINFGVLPVTFADTSDYDKIKQSSTVSLSNARDTIANQSNFELTIDNSESVTVTHSLTKRQIDYVLDGGLIKVLKNKVLK